MKFRSRSLFVVVASLLLLAACGTNKQEVQDVPVESEPTGGKAVEVVLEQLETNVDIHQNEQVVLFDIALQNENEEDITLTFNSGQQYDIVVKNDAGDEVYRYSKDKAFTQAIEDVTIGAGEAKEWHDEWVITDSVENGNYQATVEIVASQLNGESLETGLTVTKDFDIEGITNDAFRNVEVTGSNGQYVVTGEARVFEGTFLYTVEEGHDYLIDETAVQVNEGAPAWSSFNLEISIEEDKLPVNGTLTLNLFERSAEDNSIVNQYFVVLDQIGS